MHFDSNKIFRFRSIDRVLTDRELGDQYIYFARHSELNDPVEGIRNVFWCGDSIVWERFFVHYLRCLQMFFLLWLDVGERVQLGIDDIRVKRPLRGSYFTLEFEQVHRKLREMTFKNLDLSYLLTRLANRKWHRQWLVFVLEVVHGYAFNHLSNLLYDMGFRTVKRQPKATTREFWEALFDQIDRSSPDLADLALSIADIRRQERNIALSAAADEAHTATNLVTILSDFPSLYIRRIETLVFPVSNVACFSRLHHNSSMWGHYSDAHTGICLVFELQNDNQGGQCLPLLSPRDHQSLLIPCRDVDYASTLPEIDFFRYIGTIPVKQILDDWYTGFDGVVSSCASHLSDRSSWKDDRKALFDNDIAAKSLDWKYENEVRLVVPEDEDQPQSGGRRWGFDLRSLHGIIFGMNVKRRDMIAIFRTVATLCQQADQKSVFYYEAYYDLATGRVDCRPIGAATVPR